MDQAGQHQHGQGCCSSKKSVDTVKDPVCGMDVDPHTAKHRATLHGHPYYFCSAGCRTKFENDPARYLSEKATTPVDDGAIYTCPMHPQIRQVGPGTCPICGMALEPEVVTAESAPNPELADMTNRFWISLALTVPIFALEMGGHNRHLGPTAFQLDPTCSGYARRALGRMALL
jgi:P-type Cu+ transporter